MKIGNLLIKIGKKITGKKSNKKDKEVKLYATNDSKDDWACWWIFNKPNTLTIYK